MATDIICVLASMYIITRIFPISNDINPIDVEIALIRMTPDELKRLIAKLTFIICRTVLMLIPLTIILKNAIKIWG